MNRAPWEKQNGSKKIAGGSNRKEQASKETSLHTLLLGGKKRKKKSRSKSQRRAQGRGISISGNARKIWDRGRRTTKAKRGHPKSGSACKTAQIEAIGRSPGRKSLNRPGAERRLKETEKRRIFQSFQI